MLAGLLVLMAGLAKAGLAGAELVKAGLAKAGLAKAPGVRASISVMIASVTARALPKWAGLGRA